MTRSCHISRWKLLHRWGSLVISVFIVMFSISGIILNHRAGVMDYDLDRNFLPSSYHIKDYNNGVVKGTIPFGEEDLLVFGNAGVWHTDKNLVGFRDFNNGLPDGIDGRNIRNIIKTRDGKYVCATHFGVYELLDGFWHKIEMPDNKDRISDIALTEDSCRYVVLTRSNVYINSINGLEKRDIGKSDGYENKSTLFKTIWKLHSGELFGMPGRIAVDTVACILIFLSITGIIIFILPYSIRRGLSNRVSFQPRILKWNFRWHDKIGYWFAAPIFMIAFTGICLRPPLMIPCILLKTSPIPGTAMSDDNIWHDKLRAIRWDSAQEKWLISTSEGFIYVDKDFVNAPTLLDRNDCPPVSPMGVTVFEQIGPGKWIIGSFSGLYHWDSLNGVIKDYFTGKSGGVDRSPRAVSPHLVSGYSKDFENKEVVFDFSTGTDKLPAMPALLESQPISLWNMALEVHVGRCYRPFLGPVSELFIFVSGTILMLIIISGFIIRTRLRKKNNHNSKI